jgi:acyl-coenzyme A synthetase/AMP-(fatty) acid ligase
VTDSDILEKEIRIFMKDKLQNYKIPRVINFVQALETTRTGKIKR